MRTSAVLVNGPAERMSVDNGRDLRRLAKLIAKPNAELGIIHFLHREANACRQNLPDSLLGRSCCTVMRYPIAELREHAFERSLCFGGHCKQINEHELLTA
jgi:hypothetical protein